ncbi:hypothetical protein HPB50_005031 [Hyalomma asiaticum]|uniref:Uncharacterized protein n=1 Tax=Hyalomma asiaticum TaxID=266040 RepID=A0ACB7SJZ8_HYAAI|nr:hypothetical protein HPB50_005031 [Hyalomma asiaticum]
MELRVWLEGGPQRVVCGVTEATTCQDVVYALAQATAQTGRFALVERSRRSERPLAPSDRPLRLLARWGRCASDVHFLLRRCGPAVAKAGTPRGGAAAVQASPPLERVPRPRRPPPYDEAVTRLAAGAHHFFSPRGKDPPLQGLGDSPSKQPPDDYSELLKVVSLQGERLRNIHEELAQKDADKAHHVCYSSSRGQKGFRVLKCEVHVPRLAVFIPSVAHGDPVEMVMTSSVASPWKAVGVCGWLYCWARATPTAEACEFRFVIQK